MNKPNGKKIKSGKEEKPAGSPHNNADSHITNRKHTRQNKGIVFGRSEWGSGFILPITSEVNLGVASRNPELGSYAPFVVRTKLARQLFPPLHFF